MRKILIIFSLVLLILFSAFSVCFASSDYPSFDTIAFVIEPPYYDYVVVLDNGVYKMYVIAANSQEALNSAHVEHHQYQSNKIHINNPLDNLLYYHFTLYDAGWGHDSTDTVWGNNNNTLLGNYHTIIESTIDIYNSDGTVFFQKTPVLVEKITLEKIMKTTGEQATMEVGQIILIVIMTTVGLTVLLVGLKKGLTVLMNGFRH